MQLWNGGLIQKNNIDHDVDCKRIQPSLCTYWPLSTSRSIRRNSGWWLLGSYGPFEIECTSVCPLICSFPNSLVNVFAIYSYQSFFRICVWIFFLIVYSQAGSHDPDSVSATIADTAFSPWAAGTYVGWEKWFGWLGIFVVYHGFSIHLWRFVSDQSNQFIFH